METLFTGQNLIYLETVGSTNSFTLNLLKQQEVPEGTLVYTFNQDKGRGQRENAWLSEPGKNLALSFVLYPRFLPLQKQFCLTMVCSLAVRDFVKALLGDAADIKIKWPNDVYVQDKKIAGILIENSLKGGLISSSVCGFGINVNQVDFPPALSNPVSLKKMTGKEHDLQACIQLFCSCLEKNYLLLRSERYEEIKGQYLEYLYRKNEWAHYRSQGKIFSGSIQGVDDSGKLLLELEEGGLKAYDFKQIEFVL